MLSHPRSHLYSDPLLHPVRSLPPNHLPLLLAHPPPLPLCTTLVDVAGALAMSVRPANLTSDDFAQRAKRPRLGNMTNTGPAAVNGRPPTSASLKPMVAPAAVPADAVASLGRSGIVNRTHFVRLMEQALSSLGYAEVAEQLEVASGIISQPPQVRSLPLTAG